MSASVAPTRAREQTTATRSEREASEARRGKPTLLSRLQTGAGNRAVAAVARGDPMAVGTRLVADALASPGLGLAPTLRREFERGLGAELSGVTVHTGTPAAAAAASLNARAFTVGQDVVVADAHVPRELLAHEVIHAAQHGPSPTRAPSLATSDPTSPAERTAREAAPRLARGERVHIGAAGADRIARDDAAGVSAAGRVTADLSRPDPVAGVGAFRAAFRTLSGLSDADLRATLQELGRAGQLDVMLGNLDAGGVTADERARLEREIRLARASLGIVDEPGLVERIAAFKALVLDLAHARLDHNRRALAAWRQHLDARFPPGLFEAQALAVTAEHMITTAAAQGGPSLMAAESWLGAGPATRDVRWEQVIHERFRACTGCHELVRAQAIDATLLNRQEAQFRPVGERLAVAATQFGTAASFPIYDLLRPRRAEEGAPGGGAPSAVPSLFPSSAFPRSSAALQAIQRINPEIRPLGPTGYQVIPEHVFNMSPERILPEVIRLIEVRRSDCLTLMTKIRAGGVDALHFRPIVDQLLPSADEGVRAWVAFQYEAMDPGFWDIMLGFAVGIGVLLLTVFPPTAPIGIGLGIGLGISTVQTAAENIALGQTIHLGRGATDVFYPEQQRVADELIVGGAVNVVLGMASIAGGLYSAARLAAPPAPGATTAFAPRGGTAADEVAATLGPGTRSGGGFTATVSPDGRIFVTPIGDPAYLVVIEGNLASGYRLIGGRYVFVRTATVPSPGAGGPAGVGGLTPQGWALVPGAQRVLPAGRPLLPAGQPVLPAAQAQVAVFRESEKASLLNVGDVSATARTARSAITSIRADLGEAHGYQATLLRGEIGLQRSFRPNEPGVDFITAAREGPANEMWIIVTDAKTRSTATSAFPTPAGPAVPKKWMREVNDAVARVKLGDLALEQEIEAALAAGRVRLRQLNVDFSPAGQGFVVDPVSGQIFWSLTSGQTGPL